MTKRAAPKPDDTADTPQEWQPPKSWEGALLLIVDDVLTYILRASQAKPADPEAWEALGRLDKLRRHLQRESGAEPTQITDPHGRVQYTDDTEGE